MQPTNQPNQLMVLVLNDFFLSINNTIMVVPLYSWYGKDSLPVHDAAGRYSPKSYIFLGFCQGTCGPEQSSAALKDDLRPWRKPEAATLPSLSCVVHVSSLSEDWFRM